MVERMENFNMYENVKKKFIVHYNFHFIFLKKEPFTLLDLPEIHRDGCSILAQYGKW